MGNNETVDAEKDGCEQVIIENDLIGLRVFITSKRLDAGELQSLALGAVNWLLEHTPTRIPLGVR